jgi:phospholipid/cholesterol/gamma-HCH transport system substrate-binding protein
MRFRIRFADQIVGLLVIVAAALLIFVIFMLGSHQRWFARDYRYKVYFNSATGLSSNMPVQYKGFTIGNIQKVGFTSDDRVEVEIAIFETYADRVKEGSLVELVISPIGLGNQFLFYAGLGLRRLEEGETLPLVNSPEGRVLIARGLANVPAHDDSISLLISRVNTLLENVNGTVLQVQSALKGDSESSLGRIVGGAEGAVADISVMTEELQTSLELILGDIKPIVANLQILSNNIADPDGTVAAVLDSEGAVYTNLESSLAAVSGTLRNLERTTAFLPAQLPQVGAILGDLREVLQTAEQVLISLTNNPLLKKGIPAQAQTRTNGTSSRDVAF